MILVLLYIYFEVEESAAQATLLKIAQVVWVHF